MGEVTLRELETAVSGEVAAIRAVRTLRPAGGPGDKIFPPTYVAERGATTKYAFEKRIIDGQEVQTVLLDSVASQANRLEESLLEAWRRKEIQFPIVQVDFSKSEGLEDLEQITSLQAPHRIADAILRDSVLDGTLFRQSAVGRAFTDARQNAATAMYKYCPTALIFGVWDSTGPKGGLGAKFQRALVSEIVGYNAVAGVKVGSRIDPLQIQTKAGPVYQAADPSQEWTVNLDEAAKDAKGKPIVFARKGQGKGNPAAINHGNIPPTIDALAGGVTIDHAKQTIVLSLVALRRLRFITDCAGNTLNPEIRPAAEGSARTSLAALALAAMQFQGELGYDLRSRSMLIPEGGLQLEFLGRDGTSTTHELSHAGAVALVKEASERAAKHGMNWDSEPVTLTPTPKLEQLIRMSRELARTETEEEESN